MSKFYFKIIKPPYRKYEQLWVYDKQNQTRYPIAFFETEERKELFLETLNSIIKGYSSKPSAREQLEKLGWKFDDNKREAKNLNNRYVSWYNYPDIDFGIEREGRSWCSWLDIEDYELFYKFFKEELKK